MSNKNDNNTSHSPQLRFPGFTGEWEEKKLGDFFELRNGYAFRSDSYLENGKYKIITIANVQSGKLDLSKFNALSVIPDNLADYQKLKEGDILVSMTGNVGRVCMVDRPNCLLNQRVGLLEQRNQNIDKKYVYHLINSSQFEEAMIKSAQGAAQANISKDNIEHFPIVLPPSPYEQQKIAECLSSLDDMILAEGQKTEALREYKRGLMQQLFPANGATTPQLRFPGFTGEWEEKKLGEIAVLLKGRGISKVDIDTKGERPCIRYGELYTCYGEQIKTIYSRTNIPPHNLILSEINDVLIPSSGETHEDIATASCILDSGVAIGGDINIIRSPLNGIFLSFYLNSAKKYEIAHIAQGDAVVHLYGTQLANLNILFPSPSEQQKIADCLSSLDDMISAQAQKTETLREYKRGLMQQLFPQPSK